ncbi:cyclin-I isoform X3 [Pipra filicauda]|uniref:Cyclin-I n=1 Tax=Pipra filicauda TaxID=649802 RepID=A0A6J2IAC5_9PASS|nr:cyclin-I isoform X1 [Manacus vitellinus]XP_027596959.1 cyclin-I isoform X3 [Pipra filicauda]XP_051625393.1 cyclin-I isoform X1 [Manacus candei]
MKFSGPLESQRLSLLLETAISREAQMWKAHVPKIQPNQDVAISPRQRDEVIQWLAKLKYQFHLYPETLALAISLLDRFLAAVKAGTCCSRASSGVGSEIPRAQSHPEQTQKARPKYLNCIAISCFFLAAKTIEEDERIPVLKVLARDSFCGCSPAEIRRMEKIILDKLNWDLHMATPLDFLHIFHAMAVSSRPQLLALLPTLSPSQHVAALTKQLLHCMACFQLLQFKGSMLALAIVSLELEKLLPDWLALIIELLQKAQMDSSQLIHCRELVAHHLSTVQPSLLPNSVYVYSPLQQTLVTCNRGAFHRQPSSVPGPGLSKDNGRPEAPVTGTAALYQRRPAPAGGCKQASAKRKVEEMEVDDFYDGIKRLYNEDLAPEVVALENMGSVCGADVSRQEGSVSPCPPLQPVSVM